MSRAAGPSAPIVDQLSTRIVSLDALRGFDMFWIIGADELGKAIKQVSSSPWVHSLADQLEHVHWEGFRFYDLIFPLFVFLMGASAVFSLQRLDQQVNRIAAYRRLIWRAALLYFLGLLFYGGRGVDGGPEMFRYVGVLQRIAICYLVAGVVILNTGWRGITAVTAILLIGYWALMTFVPVPGVGAGVFTEGQNLANYVDQHWLPGYKWDPEPRGGQWDPEGLLSTLPAIGSALLGALAGHVLRNQRPPIQRVLTLAAMGAACLLAGWLWSFQFPIIKKIWTSSYVLVAGGFSFMLLACFYLVIDVWQWRTWARPFVWIGMNSITIYMLAELINFPSVVRRVLHPPLLERMAPYGPLVVSVLALSLAVGLCYELHRRRIFLRV